MSLINWFLFILADIVEGSEKQTPNDRFMDQHDVF